MASVARGWQITTRDLEVLAALDYAPLTARQLEKLSEAWQSPFPSLRLVRERLWQLSKAKLVAWHCYAIFQRGQPEHYYVPTRQGYQLIHGPDAKPPTKGFFSPVALGRQSHQRALSDFIVHTAVGAHRSAAGFTEFSRENALRIDVGGDTVYPDCSFLLTRGDQEFRFYVEIDNGTERIRSDKACDSIERKLRIYAAFQELTYSTRFRVLFVSVPNSRDRLLHILETATRVIRDANRTLFYGITMADYLTTPYPTVASGFIDHRGRRQSLIPDINAAAILPPRVLLPNRVAC
jgi:hypothetical protein